MPEEQKKVSNSDHKLLGDLIRDQAGIRGDQTALLFENRTTTYDEFNRHTTQIANGLIKLGIKQGDRVVFLGKNSDFYFEFWFGAAKAGVIMTPINWRLAAPEIGYILADCKPKLILCDPDFLANLDPNIDCPIITTKLQKGYDDFSFWRDKNLKTDPERDVGYEEGVLQLYTSGTTGNPKGAILSNRSLLSLRARTPADQRPQWNDWTEKDVSLIAMPIFHISGSGWGLWTLQHGAKGVVVSEFDPNQVFELLTAHQITKIMMVPTALRIVCDHPEAMNRDFSFLKYICYGGSAIPLDLMRQAIDIFQCGFVQMYGMTETAGTILALPPEDHHVEGTAAMGSIGKPLYGVEIKILDTEGREVAQGQVGEITTRSDANLKAYYNLPEATAEAIDDQGWLRTGDAGYIDDQGYIYLSDRIKDIIITGGENVYPAEVENALYSHPMVSDVAVIGIPDEKWGEAIRAIIVPTKGDTPDAADIIAYARTKIAAYKCPKSVVFRDHLPRNPSGKILRRILRDEEA